MSLGCVGFGCFEFRLCWIWLYLPVGVVVLCQWVGQCSGTLPVGRAV